MLLKRITDSGHRGVLRVSELVVRKRAGGRSLGRLTAGAVTVPCVLGETGLTHNKREGDGATPVGRHRLRGGFFRADRVRRPTGGLKLRATRLLDGWCDDPASPSYNRPVRLPFRAGHETMWRADRLYDRGLVIDYNLAPRRAGRGSAIFLHQMAENGRPTAGCVALRPDDLRRLMPRLSAHCRITVIG